MYHLLIVLCTLLFSLPTFAQPKAAPVANNPTNVHVFVDMQRMQKSKTFTDLYSFAQMNPGFKNDLKSIKDKFGIDPFKDLNTVLIHLQIADNKTPPASLMKITGNFDVQKIMAGFNQDGKTFTKETLNGKTFYIDTPADTAIWIQPKMALLGKTDRLRAILQDMSLVDQTFAHILAADSTNQDMVIKLDLNQNLLAEMRQKNPQFANFPKSLVQVNMASGLNLHIEAQGTEEQPTKMLVSQVQMGIQAALKSPQAAMFGALIKKFKVANQGAQLTLDLPLDQADVDRLKMLAGLLMMNMQRPPAQPKQPAFPKLNAPVAPSLAPAPTPVPVPAPAPAKK
jgi:hypothetical protein